MRKSNELRRARPLLGTLVEVRAAGAEPARLASAVDTAFAEVARVHERLSFHSEASELTRINREAHRRAVAVSSETRFVLAQALALSEASGGLFDVTVAPRLVRWGYLPAQPGSPPPDRRACYRDIELLPQGRVRFCRPLQIDLGGIAKGFAVDRAVEALRAAGVPAGVVNAGGDLRVFGPRSERVHVRAPAHPALLLTLTELRNQAVATSSAYASRRCLRGRWVSPFIDPLRRRPCLRAWSVSVKGETALLADGLTKVLLLGGPEALPTLRGFGAEGFIVSGLGRVLASEPRHAA